MKASSATRLRHYRRGIYAEYLALFWLMLRGYWPVAMRYKTPVGEIDLVMRRGGILVFVEVKARASQADAAYAIHPNNQARVLRAAHYFLANRREYGHLQTRFDAVLVARHTWPKHLIHAFSE